ncbi:MAG: hypothetical protein D3908_05335 [Candidatus Electrothrix sp. AUS4]|nr:hypothetical protein [Candidatus Electrothrix sp. AUS4]
MDGELFCTVEVSVFVLPGWVQEPGQAEQAYIQRDDPGKQLWERGILALHHHIASSKGIDCSHRNDDCCEYTQACNTSLNPGIIQQQTETKQEETSGRDIACDRDRADGKKQQA